MRPVIIAAGGTGGHLFPAEALAACLIDRGHRVVLMTDSRAGARLCGVFRGHDTIVLPGAGIAGRGLWRGILAVLRLAWGTLRARGHLRDLRAVCVVGFGGYPCVAPVLAAASLGGRPRIVLHEQNAVLGRANRFLARYADCLALGFASTARVPQGVRTIVTGNPVRLALAALYAAVFVPDAAEITLLVLGGSLGARIFSDVVPAAIADLPDALRQRVRIVQQCRGEDLARVAQAYEAMGIKAELNDFFTDMPGLYARAQLVISRAGASSCAEIAMAGRPSILVPLPSAIDNHQLYNAQSLAETGAGLIVAQADFSPARLTQMLQSLLSAPDTMHAMAEAAKSCAQPASASLLADEIERLMAPAEAPL